MGKKKEIVNVIIASPSDLQEERDSIPALFNSWNSTKSDILIEPIMWESGVVPAMGDHPQSIINDQIIDKGDLLVAMFWSKIGTPTPNAKSGTIDEIKEFISKKGGLRAMVYFCDRPLPHGPNEIDHKELQKLQEFRDEMTSQGLHRNYKTVSEFTGLLYRHLDAKVAHFINGELPLPVDKNADSTEDTWYRADHPDARLQQPFDFGNSLPEIADGFSKKMDDFEQQDGAGNDKFLDLGVHVYMSVAQSIDYALVLNSDAVPRAFKPKFKKISSRLEKLSESKSIDEFSKFWNEGRKISNDLNKLIQKIDGD